MLRVLQPATAPPPHHPSTPVAPAAAATAWAAATTTTVKHHEPQAAAAPALSTATATRCRRPPLPCTALTPSTALSLLPGAAPHAANPPWHPWASCPRLKGYNTSGPGGQDKEKPTFLQHLMVQYALVPLGRPLFRTPTPIECALRKPSSGARVEPQTLARATPTPVLPHSYSRWTRRVASPAGGPCGGVRHRSFRPPTCCSVTLRTLRGFGTLPVH